MIGAFLTGLREKIICGIKRPDGSVLVPPVEYDPATSEPLTEMVEGGERAAVVFIAQRADVRRFTAARDIDPAFAEALARATARARAGEGPTLIEAMLGRMRGHSEGDDSLLQQTAELPGLSLLKNTLAGYQF